jgi:Uma2 family endonuclease
MVSQIRPVTAEEFDRFVMQPENLNRNFELIAGEIVEKVVSNSRSSIIALWIMSRMVIFVDEHDLGLTSGADGGYVVSGERYIPGGAFISKARHPEMPTETYIPLAPDLAVEVLSPTNTDEEIRVKLSNYLAAGTMVWVVAPGKRVESHRAGRPVKVLFAGDTLDGEDVLPGFTLSVRDILAK